MQTLPATNVSSAPVSEDATYELPIDGMTCASCVRRVERALAKVDGVHEAAVNFATEQATVRLDPARATRDQLVRAVANAGYSVRDIDQAPSRAPSSDDSARPVASREADDEAPHRELRRDALVAAVAALPLLVLGMAHGALPWADGASGRALQLVLASIVVLGPGRRFFRLAWTALVHRSADMNTLVALGVGAAYAYSTVAVLAPQLFPHAEHGMRPHVYFEAAGAIVAFVLFGKLLESRAKKRLGDAVRSLMALAPAAAQRVVGDREEEIPVAQLQPGDIIRVRPGERVAADGEIASGSSALDESMLTGESLPVDKGIADRVFAGTLNRTGSLLVRVIHSGADSALARIVEAVKQAQGSKAPIARLADRVSAVFVPVVLAIALASFVVWFAVDPSPAGVANALERFVAVLVIACPCALGLATPAAIAVGTGRGAELGVLVKGGAALEAASRIDTVLLDKTGTLTTGRPELTDVIALERDETSMLSLVLAVEQESEHPVANAIARGARERGASMQRASGFESAPGEGVQARVGGRLVRIGTNAWLAKAGIDSAALESTARSLAERGRTPVFVAIDGALAGLLGVADTVAPSAAAAIAELRAAGLNVAMVTGDREQTARSIATDLGIESITANVRPLGKATVIDEHRRQGRVVAMVGDGVNDAPALASADVGIAIGSGADVAIAAADIALLRGDSPGAHGIAKLPVALALARRTMRTIRENLFWAFVYNVVGIPIAAGLLYPWTGWLLSPVLASAAMSLSSVSVLLNSLRLRRFAVMPGVRARPSVER